MGGETAFNVDFFDQADTYTPIVFAFVLGLSFLLLTVVFRSIVLPVKAILMNLLSVGAAYGMVVMFFQQGRRAGFVKDIASALNFLQVESIEAWIPLFLFSVLFGLSMDYHVFLLTRIREHYDLTGNNTESVAYGLRTTAGMITGAALIMVAVFGGFAAGRLAPLQQMGFGLAVAVFLDATVVRSILVPSAMKLLGRRELVPAAVARVAAEARCRGARGRRAARRDPRHAGRARRGRRIRDAAGRVRIEDVSPGAGSGSSRSRAPGGRLGRSTSRTASRGGGAARPRRSRPSGALGSASRSAGAPTTRPS